MNAAKRLSLYYLLVLLIGVISYIMSYFFKNSFIIIYILTMLLIDLVRRLWYPFSKNNFQPSSCSLFWKVYGYLFVINLFALSLFSIIDVAIDMKLSHFFKYWFFVWIGSFIPLLGLSIYEDIKLTKSAKTIS